jgi:sugar phosphate isomerase/epimerase
MTKKIGISIGALQAKYGVERALELCAKSGFDAVDFNLKRYGREDFPVYADGEDAVIEHFSKIAEYAKRLGLEISQTHGRNRIVSPDEEFCKTMKWVSRMDLLATRALGSPTCVIHSVVTKLFPNADANFMHQKNHDFFASLFPYAEELDVNIALETFGDSEANGVRVCDFFGDARELKKSFDALNSPKKVICIDTGHTNKAHAVAPEVPDVIETIQLFGKDIKVLHLNDNNGFTDQHLPPMQKMAGGIRWDEVFAALDAVGYNGVYNFELVLSYFDPSMDEFVKFLGTYLRRIVEGKA